MSFKLGPKILIVNDPAEAQLLFFAKLASGIKSLVETDDDFQTTTAFDDLAGSPDVQSGAEGAGFLPATPATDETIAQADFLRILGFVDLEGADIISVTGSKGISGQKQQSTITITIPVVVVGDELNVVLSFKSDNLEAEFASNQSDYKIKKSFTIVVRAGDTATTLADRLVADIQGIIDSGWASWVTASNVAGVVTLVSTKNAVTISASFSGSGITSGNITAAWAETVGGYPGRNTYDQLKALRLDTVAGGYAQTHLTDQVPLKNAKYSCYVIKKRVSRPDLAGTSHINDVPSGNFEFQIFINEANAAYISNLTKWLNANAAVRNMYTEVTPAGVLAADTLVSATAVDASEPFTTPLV